MIGVFREIAAPERLVFTNVAVDEKGNPLLDGLTTVTFTEEGGKTKLTLRTRATALAPYAAAFLQGMEAGWTQSLDRLAERLADASDREIVATRVFDAPRELVFRAWTDPDHLVHWWGPKGFTNTFHEFDMRPGGVWRFVMHGPDGTNYKTESVFVEIVKPERIVFDHVSAPQFRMTATFDGLGQDPAHLADALQERGRVRHDQEDRRPGQRTELRPPGGATGQDGLIRDCEIPLRG